MTEERSAAEAFSVLADGTRIDVLCAIAEAQSERDGPDAGPATLRFSEVYDRADVDGTSKLSYHLDELTGTYLRKGEDGYAFTHAGERLVRFVLSGNYASPRPFDPVPIDGTCLHCGGDVLEAALDEQFFLVRCRDCERPVTAYHVTPAQVRDVSGEALVDRVVERQTAELDLARRGTCPECAGRLATEVVGVPDEVALEAFDFVAIGECRECLRRISNPLPLWVAYHPASVAFHWDAGVDVTTRAVWDLVEHLQAGHWTADRTATDPDAYEVRYRREGEALRLHVTDDATVRSTERVCRTSVGSDDS